MGVALAGPGARRRGRAVASLVLLSCLALTGLAALTGCSDRAPSAGESSGVMDPEEKTAPEQYASGELTFGDPADDGYAPVAPVDAKDLGTAATATMPTLRRPDQVLPSLSTVRVTGNGEALSRLGPIDAAPAPGTAPTERDSAPRNDLGELLALDESASLACADAEIAVRAMDARDPDTAAAHLRAAVSQAKASTTAGIGDWAGPIATVNTTGTDVTTLVGFLTVCTDGGYEL